METKTIASESSHYSWSILWRYLGAQRYAAAALFILLLLQIGLTLLVPQVIRFFIDKLQTGAHAVELVKAAFLFLIFILLKLSIGVLRSGAQNHVSWKATNTLRCDLTRHILGLDLSFHNSHTPGDLLERIDGDVKRLNSFFSNLVPEIIGAVILALGTLVVLAFDNWRLSAVLALFLVVFIFIHRWDQQWAKPFWKRERQYAAEVSSFVEERVSGVRDIHTSAAIDYTLVQFQKKLRQHTLQSVKGEVATDAGWSVSGGFYALGFAVALGTGAYLFFRGSISLGVVYLIVQYLQILYAPMTRIGGQFENLIKAEVSIKRINNLFTTQSSLDEGSGRLLRTGSPIYIRLDGVRFGYGGENAVLHDLSFSMDPGETLGLLGRTGSGKSTLSRLLFRFYDVERGAIRFDGIDIRDYELAGLRRKISMVTQEVQLLHSSVRDNITLYMDGISDQRIIKALHQLGLGDWFSDLARGLDTRLTPGGEEMSSGQAQLLAIARAFLKEPGLVILDEASSRIDPSTERLLDGAIDKLLKNRTAVIIAHRLATVRRVDKILILDRGRIKEYGYYTDLTKDPDSALSALLRAGSAEFLI